MPAKSISQQQLFGMAIAVRKKEMKRSDVDKEVLDIVDSDMTDKEIEDFAKTKHQGLKKYVKENIKDLNEILNEALLEESLSSDASLVAKVTLKYIKKIDKSCTDYKKISIKPRENDDFYDVYYNDKFITDFDVFPKNSWDADKISDVIKELGWNK